MILGFSTGFLYKDKSYDRVSNEIVDIIKSIGCNAIEFMCRDKDHLQRMITDINRDSVKGFKYISMHAPRTALQGNREEMIDMFKLIQNIHDKFDLCNVVVHPSRESNWSVFSEFNFPLAIENMDHRGEFCVNIEDMKETLKLTNAKMVLDMNHCFSNDSSMKLAHDFINEFKDRINEVHVSGFAGFHELLFQTKQDEILDAMPGVNLPIIIESGCNNADDAKREFEYVKRYLENRN